MHLYMHPCVDIISRGSLTQGTQSVSVTLYYIMLFIPRINLSTIEFYHYMPVNVIFIVFLLLRLLPSLNRLRLHGLLSKDHTSNLASSARKLI